MPRKAATAAALRRPGNALLHYWRGVFRLLQLSVPEAVGCTASQQLLSMEK
jgi:hypothetical protein